MSQGALAKLAGCGQSTIASIERGRNQGSTILPRVAEILGVNALWLAEGRGPKQPDSLPPQPAEPSTVSADRTRPPTLADLLERLRAEIATQPDSVKRAIAELMAEYVTTPDEGTGRAVADAILRILGSRP